MQAIAQWASSATVAHRELAMQLLFAIGDTLAEKLTAHLPEFAALFGNGLRDADLSVRIAALRAAGRLLEFITDEEGAALAAAFKARLDEEGGETAFRLKSDANNLAESAKETASDGSLQR